MDRTHSQYQIGSIKIFTREYTIPVCTTILRRLPLITVWTIIIILILVVTQMPQINKTINKNNDVYDSMHDMGSSVTVKSRPVIISKDIEFDTKYEESTFFTGQLTQNNSRLLDFVHRNFLIPPSDADYNLRFRWGDPARREQQNKYVLKILNGMRNGFFVESGANDGETLSSTLILERDYSWEGLLIEPDPYAFSQLQQKNRKAWSSQTCLATKPYPQKVTFLHSLYSTTRSGVDHIVKIPKGKIEKVNATCLPLFTLLSALKIDVVDYFCLDVEGAELKILKTIPFDSIFIKILAVEYEHIPEGRKALRKFMESKGYIVVKELSNGDAADYLFVHESLKDQLPKAKPRSYKLRL